MPRNRFSRLEKKKKTSVVPDDTPSPVENRMTRLETHDGPSARATPAKAPVKTTGAPASMPCAACGEKNPDTAKHCHKCSFDLTSRLQQAFLLRQKPS